MTRSDVWVGMPQIVDANLSKFMSGFLSSEIRGFVLREISQKSELAPVMPDMTELAKNNL